MASLIGVAHSGDKAVPKLDGRWVETGGTDGKKLPEDIISQRKFDFVFETGKYTFSKGGKEFEAMAERHLETLLDNLRRFVTGRRCGMWWIRDGGVSECFKNWSPKC